MEEEESYLVVEAYQLTPGEGIFDFRQIGRASEVKDREIFDYL